MVIKSHDSCHQMEVRQPFHMWEVTSKKKMFEETNEDVKIIAVNFLDLLY